MGRKKIISFVDISEQNGRLTKFERKRKQEGRQEGRQEGMQKVFALLERGYSLDDAKKKLQLA